jgi:TetR/AcrR family transcriptional regulator
VPDDSESRIALLDAAEALFARHGYAATTIKAIGAEARVNPALLYYYFPDKERLYHAVLERRLGTFARRMTAELPSGLPPLEAIERILRGYAAMMQGAPLMPRLLARELADHEAAHALPVIRELAAGLFQRICDLIRAGQRSGQVRGDLDPRFTAISLVSQMAWFFVAQPAVSRLLGYEGTVPPAQVERYTDHAVAFTLAALTPAHRRPRTRRTRQRTDS